MPQTFGASTGDDLTITSPTNTGADNQAGLIVGTWYPTTLTATRAYFGVGVTGGFRAVVDGTTSEIRMHTNNATTPGQWVTTGAGITTNQWWFIAWMYALENTGPAGAWRVWIGTETQFPTEVTVTNPTAPVGGYTGNAGLTVGNAGSSGTVAFQGDIGWFSLLNHTAAPNADTIVPVTASGAISDSDAAHVLQRWVIPFYYGLPRLHGASSFTSPFQMIHFALRPLAQGVCSWSNQPESTIVATASGTVIKSEREPFTRPPDAWPILYPYVRR